jgi:hypothetical protein
MKMENETNEAEQPVSEAVDRLKKEVGTVEKAKLEAKPVQCQGVRIDEQFKKDKTTKVGDIVKFICKHPDKDENMELSQSQHIVGTTVKEVGLWYNEDEDENIQKGTALADLIKHMKVTSLNDLIGKEFETVVNNAGFLVIKGF